MISVLLLWVQDELSRGESADPRLTPSIWGNGG